MAIAPAIQSSAVSRARIAALNDNTPGTVWAEPTETAVLANAATVAFLDARLCATDASGYVLALASRKRTAAGLEQTATAPDITHAMVRISTTDGRVGINTGMTAAGGSDANHTRLVGDVNLVLPASPFYVAWIGLPKLPASSGILWATGAAAGAGTFALLATSDGRARLYYNYSSNSIQSSAGVIDGTTPGELEVTYDGTTFNVYLNGTVIATGTPSPATVTNRALRFMSASDGGSGAASVAKEGSYMEAAIVGNAVSAPLRAAVKAMLLSPTWHPGWTIA